MSNNNIYNILESFGKVAQEAKPLVESTETKTNKLAETMEGILADRYQQFKEASGSGKKEHKPTHGKSPKELGGADAYYHRPCDPEQYGFEKGSEEYDAYKKGFAASDEGKTGGKQYEGVEQLDEKMPPGFPKELYHKIKKQYASEPEKAYATMWMIHNKKKNESMEEDKEKPMSAFHPDFIKKQREKEGTGKFDKFDTGYSKRYTKKDSKPDFLDLDKDGDTDEPMKSAAKDAKKKRGRPRKNESLLDSLISEYSEALGASANLGSQGDLKGIMAAEAENIDQDQLRQHLGDEMYGQAVAFLKSGEKLLPAQLEQALYDYYVDTGEIPYEVAKDDPSPWLIEKLQQMFGNEIDRDDNRPEINDVDSQPSDEADKEPIPQESMNMNESLKDLAKLAGITLTEAEQKPTGPAKADIPAIVRKQQGMTPLSLADVKGPKAGSISDPKNLAQARGDYKDMDEGNEFTGALARAKAAGAEEFEVDGKKYKVEECGGMMPQTGSQPAQAPDFNINASINGNGEQSLTVNAQGEAAQQLAQLLKLSGLFSGEMPQQESIEEDERYDASTTPDEHVFPISTLTKGGDGEVAGKEKTMHKDGAARFSDNPLAMKEEELEEAEIDPIANLGRDLMQEYESIKMEADYSAKKARAGKDIGKPGKAFSKIAADAAERYGSKERGEKVAGAVLAKLRGK